MLTSTYINTIWLRNRIVDIVCSRTRNDRGSSLVEYALLLALIAVVCVGAVSALGANNSANATDSANSIALAN
jgi:Flp pilus assembly pilin Flp